MSIVHSAMIAHKCLWCHGAMLINASECCQVLLVLWHNAHECFWLVMKAQECYGMLMSPYDSGSMGPSTLMSTNEH